MASFRIYLPLYLLRSEQERPELITVSEVSAQARFNPLLLPKSLRFGEPRSGGHRQTAPQPVSAGLVARQQQGRSINQAVLLQSHNDLSDRGPRLGVNNRAA
jgi:hypothetical protein